MAKVRRIALDNRGRITIPKRFREGVESFEIQPHKDGSIKLEPQKVVSIREAEILKSLRTSIAQFKQGKTKPVPKKWLK